MSANSEHAIRHRLRSPRAAAMAGILFSILLIASMLVFHNVSTISPADINSDWIESNADNVSLALNLVPFAGIAFLWFTGVIRDLLGDQEDKLFATVFWGSGLIYVALLFIWAATLGAIIGSHAVAANRLVDNDIYIFGITFINEIVGNYTLRIAGVYMLSIASLSTRTRVMPRWLTIITYILGLGFLLFAGPVWEVRFAFPAWVFLISAYILMMNYRSTHHLESTTDLSSDD